MSSDGSEAEPELRHVIHMHTHRPPLIWLIAEPLVNFITKPFYWFRDYFWDEEESPVPEPPYEHVTQIGDPILRQKAIQFPIELLDNGDYDFVIRRMIAVLNKYQCVGLAACQIASRISIMIMEFSEEALERFSPEIKKERGMEYLPLTVRLRIFKLKCVLYV